MRHKYDTRGIVFGWHPAGEANASVVILTKDLGLVHARATALRRSGAKLSPALQTFAESDLVLVRGAEGWRATGAVLAESWFSKLSRPARPRAGRVAGLLLRLAGGDAPDERLFELIRGYFVALSELPEDAHDAAEIRAALGLLSVLGFSSTEPALAGQSFTSDALAEVTRERSSYVTRVNQGIEASGL